MLASVIVQDIEQDAKALLHHSEDGTVEVQKWITEVPYNAFQRLRQSVQGRKAGRAGIASLDKEDRGPHVEARVRLCLSE